MLPVKSTLHLLVIHQRSILILSSYAIVFGLLSYNGCLNLSMMKEEKSANQIYPSKSNNFLAHRLKTDRFPLSRSKIVQAAQGIVPNFPVSFWEENQHKELYYKNRSCARFPSVYTLQVNNLYWQILTIKEMTYYLYSAYYDVRKYCSVCPAVRLLAMINKRRANFKTYCQIWFADSKEPVIVESQKYFNLFDTKTAAPVHPIMITCSLPPKFIDRVPIFVSLVENMCDIANNCLHVNFNRPSNADGKKKSFAVCVKNSNFLHEDLSTRLVEWIELLQLLGADKITFHPLYIHTNMTKVLKYYEQRGLVDITRVTLAGNQINAPYYQHLFLKARPSWETTFGNEVLQLNDCFYKNMYLYDYITALDIDEVIIPQKEYDWRNFMNVIKKKKSNTTSYSVYMMTFPDCPNATVFEDIPPYMYMLQHVFFDEKLQSKQATPKSFLNTELTEGLNNHRSLRDVRDVSQKILNVYRVSREDARLFHYRNQPYGSRNLSDLSNWHCDVLTKENKLNTMIWKYKEPLINATINTLYNLQFFN